MKNWGASAAALAALLALTSCGGEDGPVTGGTPTPSPTATASPTPSPSPTPTFSYTEFANLTGDQNFATGCVEFAPANGGAFRAQLFSSIGQFNQINYAAASETWSVTSVDGLQSGTFGPAEFVEKAGLSSNYRNQTVSPPQNFSFVEPVIAGQTALYTRGAVYFFGTVSGVCTLGVPTDPDDLPTAPTLTFSNLELSGNYFEFSGGNTGISLQAPIVSGSGTVTGNTSTGDFTVELTLTIREQGGAEYVRGPFVLTGGADVGTDAVGFTALHDINAPYFAVLSGGLYGPQGAEAGFSVVISEDLNNDGVPDRSYIFGGAAGS